MPDRAVKRELLTFLNEEKFTAPLSIYYPGLQIDDLRAELSSIVNTTISELYSKFDLGLIRSEIIDILKKGLRKFDCFNLSDNDLLYARQYLNRILIIIEWDCDPEDLLDSFI